MVTLYGVDKLRYGCYVFYHSELYMTYIDKLEKTIDKIFSWVPRQKPDTKTVAETKVAAHRGAHDNFQGIIENSLESFDRAVDLGCWGIEFDVQCCRDNVLIVHHDLDFKRLFQRDERVDQIKWSQFEKKLPQVPTLAQVINKYGKKQMLFIELKDSFNQYEQLSSLLSHLNPTEDYYIISLDESRLQPLKSIPREAQLLIPVHNNVTQLCKLALEKSYGGVLGHYLFLTNRHIQSLISADKAYGVGFVESKASLYREMSRQIPWLFSNNVAAIIKWLEELKMENENPDRA